MLVLSYNLKMKQFIHGIDKQKYLILKAILAILNLKFRPSNSSGDLQRTATNTAFLIRFSVIRFPDGPNIRI